MSGDEYNIDFLKSNNQYLRVNGSSTNLTDISNQQARSLNMDNRYDVDWFKIDTSKTGSGQNSAQISLTGIPAGDDYNLVGVDSAGNVIGSSNKTSNQSEALNFMINKAANSYYYVCVYANTYGASTHSASLSFSTVAESTAVYVSDIGIQNTGEEYLEDLAAEAGATLSGNMVASNYGNLEMVKYLISEGSDKEIRTMDAESNKTALYFAVENDQYDVAEYLIKMGADIKPYKIFAGTVDVFNAAWENGNAKMMKLILDSGYKSNKSVEDCLFINALKSGDSKELKKFKGYSYKGFDYTNALATYKSKLETIKYLVENGAVVNSPEGDEVMLSAAEEGNTDIVEYLISRGANVNAVSVGIDGDVKDKKINSTLYSAIIRGNLDIIKLLIENGADIEQELDFSGGTEAPVLTAAGCSSKNILEYFLKKGAKVNYQNNKGNSPLMRAAYAGRIDNLKILLSYKADKQLKDSNGHTAMDLAKEKKQKEIVDYLEKQK